PPSTGTGLGVAAGILLGALVGAHPAACHASFVVSAVAVGIGVIATLVFVRDSPARAAGGLDVLGAALLTPALVSLLLGLSQGPAWGWGSPPVILLLVGG
ncbi:MAG: MFS transporter, partial [bacterium]|nr:MFS transporter [bacterium]